MRRAETYAERLVRQEREQAQAEKDEQRKFRDEQAQAQRDFQGQQADANRQAAQEKADADRELRLMIAQTSQSNNYEMAGKHVRIDTSGKEHRVYLLDSAA